METPQKEILGHLREFTRRKYVNATRRRYLHVLRHEVFRNEYYTFHLTPLVE